MLRRALLLAFLLAPVAGRGQTINVLPAGPFTPANCADASFGIVVYWGMAAGTTTPLSGWTYRILASTTSQCSYVATSGSTPSNVVGSIAPNTSIDTAGLNGQRFPTAASGDTLTFATVAAAAQTTCAAGPTVYLCVQLVRNDTAGTVESQTGTVKLAVEVNPPSIPVITSVQPGQGALIVNWRDGTDSTVAAATYTVSVLQADCVPVPPLATCVDNVPHTLTTTSNTSSARVDGLTIGLKYQVLVYSNSGGGLTSVASAPAYGTPINVKDFWALYKDAGGLENGGCGGGPAGVLSLLAMAGLVRGLRRRS
jgi:hypothetical protein